MMNSSTNSLIQTIAVLLFCVNQMVCFVEKYTNISSKLVPYSNFSLLRDESPSKVSRVFHPLITLTDISFNNLYMKVIVGTGTEGVEGDTGPASSAQIRAMIPWMSTNGDLYIADEANHRIRRVTPNGIIRTIGGTGSQSTSGTTGLLSAVSFYNPHSIVGDTAGTFLYISDQFFVWKYIFSSDTATVYILGGGFDTDNGPVASARVNNPRGLWLTTSNILYIADYDNHRIRKISSDIITTVAGLGCHGGCAGSFAGDGGPALSANLNLPYGTYMDSNGKLFIADSGNFRIRLVATNNIITTFAGNGVAGFNGDNIPATQANINVPTDVKGDSSGNIYIADRANCIIRIVVGDIISTLFGIPGSSGFSPGVSFRASNINNPYGIWVDSQSTVYFSDYTSIHSSVTVSSPTSQPSRRPTGLPTSQPSRQPSSQPSSQPTSFNSLAIMKTIGGNGTAGYHGDGMAATRAQLSSPNGLFVDSTGNLFIMDSYNHRIRKVDSNGIVSTFGGSGSIGTSGIGGFIQNVNLYYPNAIVYDSSSGGSLYFVDQYYVWKYSYSSGIVLVIAGTTVKGFSGDGGQANLAQVNEPCGIWLTSSDIYFNEVQGHRVRKIDRSNNVINSVAGGTAGFCGDNGPAAAACFSFPNGIFVNFLGLIFIADTSNHRIRKIDTNGIITTFAGTGATSFNGDNLPATSANLKYPTDMKMDGKGDLFIADTDHSRIRRVKNGIITTVVGNGVSNGSPVSTWTAVLSPIESPRKLFFDSMGNLYFSTDTMVFKVMELSPTSQPTNQPSSGPTMRPSLQAARYLFVQVIAGNGQCSFSGGGGKATAASICSPRGMAVDTAGNLLFGDTDSHRIRCIDSNDIITTFGGTGTFGTSGIGGPIRNVDLHYPFSFMMNPSANTFYFADQVHIWKYSYSNGNISVVAGTDTSGYSGDGGSPILAQVNPYGLWLTTQNLLYFADRTSNRIRMIDFSANLITTVAGSSSSGFCGNGGQATAACLYDPIGVFVNTAGILFIADGVNCMIRQVTTNGIITTFAGTGQPVFNGDNIPATSANLNTPHDVKGDSLGTIYITDGNCRVRRVRNGIITTIVGNGICQFSPGINAALSPIEGATSLFIDSLSNLYFTSLTAIYKVITLQPSSQPTEQPTRQPSSLPTIQPSSRPTIQPSLQGNRYFFMQAIAGTGQAGYNGDGIKATLAKLFVPRGLSYDLSGNLLIGDSENHRIRQINSNGIITTLGGTGISGSAGNTGSVSTIDLLSPAFIVLNPGRNLFYFTDAYYIWQYSYFSGNVSVIAGTALQQFSGDGAPANLAQVNQPFGLWLTSPNLLYFADRMNHRIRVIDLSTNHINTVAGNGNVGFCGNGMEATSSCLDAPLGVFVSSTGIIFIADSGNNMIRQVAVNGIIQAFAGSGVSGYNGDNIPATSARLTPLDVKGDIWGNIYIADYANCRIRRVTNGIITTLVGTGICQASFGQVPVHSPIDSPNSLYVDSLSNIYFTTNLMVYKLVSIEPSSQPTAQPTNQPSSRPTMQPSLEAVRYLSVQVIAGNGLYNFGGDGGKATAAAICSPLGFAADTIGNFLFGDALNSRIRRIDSSGIITTFVGDGNRASSGIGGPIRNVSLYFPRSIMFTPAGNSFYFTDEFYIWKYSSAKRNVSVIAGTSTQGYSGDGGPAKLAQVNPYGLWLTTHNLLYFADRMSNRIRMINLSGNIITTVAGNGNSAFCGNGGQATAACLYAPLGVFVNAAGVLFIADSGHHLIHQVATNGIITIVAGTGQWGFNGDNIPATNAQLKDPYDVKGDSFGTIYIADYNNCRIRRVKNGIITTLVGTGATNPNVASVENPSSLFIDSLSNLYFTAITVIYKVVHLQPSSQPTSQPTRQPTCLPTNQPSSRPTIQPSLQASRYLFLQAIAGTGQAGFNGDGVKATLADLWIPKGLSYDLSGNLLFGDSENHRIRQINSNEVISTVGGTGVSSSSGKAGPVRTIDLLSPGFSMLDPVRNLYYFTDGYYVWKYSFTSGNASVVTGTNSRQFSGDGGPANLAQVNEPLGLWLTTQNLLYFADRINHRIRMIDLSSNIINTVAGNGNVGFCGNGVQATSTCLFAPYGVFVSSAGIIFIADAGNQMIRQVAVNGIIQTIAGTGLAGCNGDNIPATNAKLKTPLDVKGDTIGNIYIADCENCRIRQVTDGIITTLVGTGICQASFGQVPVHSPIESPNSLFIDSLSNVYFTTNLMIYKLVIIEPSSQPTSQPTNQPSCRPTMRPSLEVARYLFVQVIAGDGQCSYGGDGGKGTIASICSPLGLSVDTMGNFLFGDVGNCRIRRIDSSGIITTFGGTGSVGSVGIGGPILSIDFHYPLSIAVSHSDNVFYFTDQLHVWKYFYSSGNVSAITGTDNPGYSGDGGLPKLAQVNNPYGIWLTTHNFLYFADRVNHRIRMIDLSANIITTVAGNGNAQLCGNAGQATEACLYGPLGVFVNTAGILFIADTSNGLIRRVTTDGIITNFAGNAQWGFNGDNIPATNAQFKGPYDVKGDSLGTIYIADNGNFRVRRVINGIITTLVGNGIYQFSPGINPALSSTESPTSLFIDSLSNLYFTANTAIYKVITIQPSSQPTGQPTLQPSSATIRYLTLKALAGTGVTGYNGEGLTASLAQVNLPTGLWADSLGNLIFCDSGNLRIRKVNRQSGVLNTFGGTGMSDSSGVTGPFRNTSFYSPECIVGDPSVSYLYFTDLYYVWKYSYSTGQASVIAGVSTHGFSGDDHPASLAKIWKPLDLWLTTDNLLYFVDLSNNRIRRITLGNGLIHTFAGNGNTNFCGDGSLALIACLYSPYSIYVDTTGVAFISDLGNQRIRKVTTNGFISTFAGTGLTDYNGDNVPATSANLNYPYDAKGDNRGNIYITDSKHHRIRRVQNGIITTLVGTNTNYPSLGQVIPLPASIESPRNLFVDSVSNTIYFTTDSMVYQIVDLAPSSQPTSQPTCHPSRQPTNQPSSRPSMSPSRKPSAQPLSPPTSQPSRQPSSPPSSQPSRRPATFPTGQPSSSPSKRPSSQPSAHPSNQPSTRPTRHPSSRPSDSPSSQPSCQPTARPSRFPSSQPSRKPSVQPTRLPSSFPSCLPTTQPSSRPSVQPSGVPSGQPTNQPTRLPTVSPSTCPSAIPSSSPSSRPTTEPTSFPSSHPTSLPTSLPTVNPTGIPTSFPTSQPTNKPSSQPTSIPTTQPWNDPTAIPTVIPSSLPTGSPSCFPSGFPSISPFSLPSGVPTSSPSILPTNAPSSLPSEQPVSVPTVFPSVIPSVDPTRQPFSAPTSQPSSQPTPIPLSCPSNTPSTQPSSVPSAGPTSNPFYPSCDPTAGTSGFPTSRPSVGPSPDVLLSPLMTTSVRPSENPTLVPSNNGPTIRPSIIPTSGMGMLKR
jgi:sugar lactone lactonase YvrE